MSLCHIILRGDSRVKMRGVGAEDCYGICKDTWACLHALHPNRGSKGMCLQENVNLHFLKLQSD